MGKKKKEGPEIETRTPDQMLDEAYRRNLRVGEAFIRKFPRPIYEVGKKYRYHFDKGTTFTFVSYDDEFYRTFRRADGQLMKATKYSAPPEETL